MVTESQEQHCFIIFLIATQKLKQLSCRFVIIIPFPCCVNADPSLNRKRVSDIIRISTHGLNGQYLYDTGTQFDSDDFLEIFWKNAGCLIFNNPIEMIKTLIER